MNAFAAAFSASLEATERVMGEPWRINGTEYMAISIEPLTAELRAIGGGMLLGAETTVEVRAAVAAQSGVKANSVIEIPNVFEPGAFTRVRVVQMGLPRDGSVTIYCGPVGVQTPRR
jgi:hypothetical protein